MSVLGAVLAVGLVSGPAIVSAERSGNNPAAERQAVRAKKAQLATTVDALKADDAQVSAALDALQANVNGQAARVEEANRALAQAEAAYAEAQAAVEAKTAEIAGLREEIRAFAVEAFVHPPADDAMAALDAADPGEAATKQALLKVQSSSDADLLDRLSAAEEDLEVERQAAEAAAKQAEEKKAEASGRLAELQAARDQQAAYAAQVEARLDRALGEAAALAELDSQLSKQIAAQQAELARKSAAASGGRSSGGGGGSSRVTFNGSLSSVSCPTGGSITVASSIAGKLQSLLNAASADGIQLCGGGYRSSAGQIATRRSNCGSSNYAIYEMPASSCRPPTARPGSSMHEQGLAIDFTHNGSTIRRGTAANSWLMSNAPSFGFRNLPSEAWHYSTTGG